MSRVAKQARRADRQAHFRCLVGVQIGLQSANLRLVRGWDSGSCRGLTTQNKDKYSKVYCFNNVKDQIDV